MVVLRVNSGYFLDGCRSNVDSTLWTEYQEAMLALVQTLYRNSVG